MSTPTIPTVDLDDLRADDATRTLYSTDASLYQVMPHAVLIPRHADDMQAAIELAARYAVPVLPRAGSAAPWPGRCRGRWRLGRP